VVKVVRQTLAVLVELVQLQVVWVILFMLVVTV
jgi:hypothetical protein